MHWVITSYGAFLVDEMKRSYSIFYWQGMPNSALAEISIFWSQHIPGPILIAHRVSLASWIHHILIEMAQSRVLVSFSKKIGGNARNYWHEEVACNKWELARKIHSFLPTIIALITRWIARKERTWVNRRHQVLTAIFVWENRQRDTRLGLLDLGRSQKCSKPKHG